MFFQIIMMLASTILQSILAPKPPKPPAATLADFSAPTAEEGGEIPVVFGTVWINAPNMLWYGNLGTKPIKTKGGKK